MPSDRIDRIEGEHDRIHEGVSFTVNLVDISMGDGDTINIAFKTPNTLKRLHMIMDWSTLAGGHLELIEAPTWGNQTGTSIAIINRYRGSTVTSGLEHDLDTTAFVAESKVSANVTTILTTNATTVQASYLFSAASNKGAAESRGRAEFLLKPNTQYVIKYTADGGSNAGFVKLSWYEYIFNAI